MFYTRNSYAEEWKLEPYLEWAGGNVSSEGHGESSFEVEYAYGYKRWTNETEETIRRAKTDMINKYLRVDFVSGTVHRVVFVGIIREDVRVIKGTKTYEGTSVELGRQKFIAYGPRSILEKHDISNSYWQRDNDVVECEWIPNMNLRDRRGRLVGNRTGTLKYGGNLLWSHYDYLIYLLENHFPTCCKWYVGGQADLLKNMYTQIEWAEVESAHAKLMKLIPLDYGIDFHLFPVDDGFTIHVYARNPYSISFGNQALPANQDYLQVKTTTDVGLIFDIRIENTQHFRYSGIRLFGRRSLIVASPTLVPKWTEALETAYLEGTGTASDSADKHDAARKADLYDHVFQRFAAESNWTLSRQAAVRETKNWIPLREGYDYSYAPPVDNNPTGVIPGYMRATAWIKHPSLNDLDTATGANISALENEWGILVEPTINHIYGKNHVGSYLDTYESNKEPQYDYETLVCTIAFESDTRLSLAYYTNGGDGSIKEVYDRSAELWEMAPNTIVGVANDGTLLDSGSEWRTLRDDTEFLNLKMAGLIAKHVTDRARAIVSSKHLYAASYYIGKIFTTIDGSSDLQKIQAPITNVQFTREGRTIFRTGYAQS